MKLKYTGAAFLVLAVMLFLGKTQAQSVIQSKLGDGLHFVAADSSFSLQLRTRFQLLYQITDSTTSTGTQNWSDRFYIRRARVAFGGFVYSPKLEYMLEIGFSPSDRGSSAGEEIDELEENGNLIIDALVKWELTPGLTLFIGQAMLPGSRERVMSSRHLQFVGRSLLTNRLNLARDVGVQVRSEHSLGDVGLRGMASVSMGEGREINFNYSGGYTYTGRIEVLPFGFFSNDGDYQGADLEREEHPKLALAATFDLNNNASRSRGQAGEVLGEERDLRTWFADAIFKYRGFSAMAEYANRKATDGSPVVSFHDDGTVKEAFVTGRAINVQAGYVFTRNWELAARYAAFEPVALTGANNEKQYTLGLSKYIVGQTLKVQGDITRMLEQGREGNLQFRLQLEIGL